MSPSAAAAAGARSRTISDAAYAGVATTTDRAGRSNARPKRSPATTKEPSGRRSTRVTLTSQSTVPTARASASVSVCMPSRNEKLDAAFFDLSEFFLRSRAPMIAPLISPP